MPSLFPGLDPYLEGSLWTTLHFSLSAEIVRDLAPKLQPRYLVLPTECFPISVPHVTIEIRDTAHRQLVTAIEVLSPTNKRGEGREEYLAKRGRVLLSNAHLLEIDFLRRGQRVPMQQPLPSTPYFVFLSRAEKRPLTEVWPIALNQALPTVPIPLLPSDEDVPLNLQQILTATYDLLGYHLAVDYTQPPEIPLDDEAAAWAMELLRVAKLRE
jgi:hypothetical protein